MLVYYDVSGQLGLDLFFLLDPLIWIMDSNNFFILNTLQFFKVKKKYEKDLMDLFLAALIGGLHF